MMGSEYLTFIFAFSAIIEFFVSGMCKQKLNLFLFYLKNLVKYSPNKNLQARGFSW